VTADARDHASTDSPAGIGDGDLDTGDLDIGDVDAGDLDTGDVDAGRVQARWYPQPGYLRGRRPQRPWRVSSGQEITPECAVVVTADEAGHEQDLGW